MREGVPSPGNRYAARMSTLVLHGFDTSNNIKVRIALGYKGIPYEFRRIDPTDREDIVRISGQHLTPVIEHGGVVLFDSAAILRYLDANFPGTPKLYGDDQNEQWAIEDWEFWARTVLAGPMMEVIHTAVAGSDIDEEMGRRCQEEFDAAVLHLATRMDAHEWLVGSRMTASDITAAAVVFRIHDAGLFQFPAGTETLVPYVERVMAYDELRPGMD